MAKVSFTRKKVESMTLGEKLKKIRSEYRISLSEVSKQTKIQIKYLEYLENGEYEKLPAEVYVRGFVRSYAHFLGTDETVLVKLYEQESNIQKNLKKDQFTEKKESPFNFPHVIVTPKLFIIAGAVMLTLGSFLYLYNEFQSFAAVPQLTITEPFDGASLVTDEVYIRGTTEKDASLLINGQPVLVRENGDFYEQVHLQSGLNTFTVVATNKFKKERSVTLSVQSNHETKTEVTPLENIVPSIIQKPKKLTLSSQKKDISVKLAIDTVIVFDGVMSTNEVKEFDIEKEYVISTSDALHTMVGIDNAVPAPVDAEIKKITDKHIVLEAQGAHPESPVDSAALGAPIAPVIPATTKSLETLKAPVTQ